MARVWVILAGGRAKRFKAPQVKHHCRKRRHGRPAVGVGLCYPINEARKLRRLMNARLRQEVRTGVAFEEDVAVLAASPSAGQSPHRGPRR